MKLYCMAGKAVVKFENKACEFLKAYTTNTLDKPKNAFVDLRGRIVATFDQARLSEDEVLVVLEGRFLDRLSRHLEKYLSLTETNMEKTGYRVYWDLEANYKPAPNEILISTAMILTERRLPAVVSEEEFTLFRVRNRMPIQGVDYDDELILSVTDEEFVSYTKGCYLGQEIVARVHFRSRPPLKLVVKREKECGTQELSRMTSVCLDPDSGTKMGFVFLEND